MKRLLWLGLVLVLLAVWTGCGDTFRPIIIPNPPAFPDPRAAHTVISINDNGPANDGTVMVVDVSGDTDIGVRHVGVVPVHAVQQSASQVLVVDQATDPTTLADSLKRITFSGIAPAITTDISLPPGSQPNFVAVAPSDTTAYVTLPKYVPDPTHPVVVPSVGVVNLLNNALVATIPVGNNPLALAVTPDKSKLYVANKDDNTVSGFNTIDRSARPIDLNGFPPFNAPLWILVRSDNQRVYVLNGDGTLVTLDPTAGAGTTDQVISVLPSVGTGATHMLYDGLLNRLYIPSQDPANGAQLVIVDVSAATPPLPVKVPISIAPPSSRGTQDPCASTAVNSPLTATSVAALPDGSRVYAGAYYSDSAGNICPQVTVINTSANTIKTTVPVPGFSGESPFSPALCSTTRFRFNMAAGGDSSRVYLASCDGGNVNIIRTLDDTYLLNLPSPASLRPPIPPNNQPPPQNPVFLIAGP